MASSSVDHFHLFEKIWYCLVFHLSHVTHPAASNSVPFLSVVVVNFGHHIQTNPRMALFFFFFYFREVIKKNEAVRKKSK